MSNAQRSPEQDSGRSSIAAIVPPVGKVINATDHSATVIAFGAATHGAHDT